MSQQNIPPEWQEAKRIVDTLIQLGFSTRIENIGVHSARDRIYFLRTFPRHQVEWLRTYATIYHVQPLADNTYIVNAPSLKEYFCDVAFRMKDVSVAIPLPDADAILPPKDQS